MFLGLVVSNPVSHGANVQGWPHAWYLTTPSCPALAFEAFGGDSTVLADWKCPWPSLSGNELPQRQALLKAADCGWRLVNVAGKSQFTFRQWGP